MKIRLEESLVEKHPDVVVGYAELDGVSETRVDELEDARQRVLKLVLDSFSPEKVSENKNFSMYAETFSKMGQGSSKSKNFPQVLLEKTLRDEEVPSLNPVMDCLFFSELQNQVELLALDKDALTQNIVLRLAEDGEEISVGGKKSVLGSGEIVACDEKGVIASYTKGNDSRSRVSADTRNVLLLAFGAGGMGEKLVKKALLDAANYMKKLINAKLATSGILSFEKGAKKILDPWGSSTVSDYGHVVREFGLKPFPEKWREKLKHLVFERGIVYAHRGFEKIMQRIEEKRFFINMTGIATSGHLHFGHKLIIDIFVFFKSLGAENFFGVCDLDAYVSRPDSKVPSLKKAKEYAVETAAHALALGLEPQDIYAQSNKEQRYYGFTFELSKKITASEYSAIYGHMSPGKMSAVLLQLSDILHQQLPEYLGKNPSITAIAVEQDPHLRLVRDVAKKLPYDMEVPSSIYIKHQSGLQEGKKMSASEPNTAIFLTDSPKEAAKKISTSYTGGRNTLEEQRKKGGRPEICKVFELLKYHYPDSERLRKIEKECKSGVWICGECKNFCAEYVKSFLEKHQAKVAKNMELAGQIVLGKKRTS